LSNPKKFIYNSRHVCGRIFDYFEKILNTNISIPTELNYLQKKYLDEASKLFKNDKKYIGFSITSGHPTRQKEISLKTIVEVANYFSDKNFVPTFFIEEKYKEKINTIKAMVKNPYFPELLAQSSLKNPLLVVAMGRKLHSAISINNGIMHMLGLAGTKTAIFFDENSDKFRPLDGNKSKIYSSSKNKETKDLTPKDIINFVNNFI
jgi:ADP-heptose:LPS heptosyltransferase